MINVMTVISVKTPIDSYMNGYCMRCGRKRVDCETVRAETEDGEDARIDRGDVLGIAVNQ